MKTKDSKETNGVFLTTIPKRSRPNKIWVKKGTELATELKKTPCKDDRIQIYSTMSETKVAFAERTIQSMKKILHRYMEDYGYKHIHNLSQFVTTMNSRKISWIDLIP